MEIAGKSRDNFPGGSGGLKVLRAPGKKQYAGTFQQCWNKDQILLYGSIV